MKNKTITSFLAVILSITMAVPTMAATIDKGTTGNKTYKAEWKICQHTLTFNPNGGTLNGNTSKALDFGSPYGELPTPSHQTKEFNGWFTEKEGGEKVTENTIMNNEDVTIYAHYEDKEYNVTLHGQYARDNRTIKVTPGKPYGPLGDITQKGDRFIGWYTDADGGTQVTSDDIVNITSDQDLYPHFTRNSAIINYDANGGTNKVSKQSVLENSDFPTYDYSAPGAKNKYKKGEENEPERDENHYFDGWSMTKYSDEDSAHYQYSDGKPYYDVCHSWGVDISHGVSQRSGNVEEIINYTVWRPSFKINYHLNGGEGKSLEYKKFANPYWSSSNYYSSEYRQKPTRKGYIFDGWYLTPECNDNRCYGKNGPNDPKDVDLYAKWELNDIIFDYNYENKNNETESGINYIKYSSDKSGSLPKDPERSGYTFVGWYTDPVKGEKVTKLNEQTLKNAPLKNDIFYPDMSWGSTPVNTKYHETEESYHYVLYAHWTPNTYTITFDSKGGTVSQSTKQVKVGETYGTLPTPTKSGCTFYGWSYTQYPSTTEYLIKPNFIFNMSKDLTLYAIWYELSDATSFYFDQQKGSYAIFRNQSISNIFLNQRISEDKAWFMNYGKKNNTAPVPVYSTKAYKFLGYYTAPNGGGTQYFDEKGNATRNWDKTTDLVLYAKWGEADAIKIKLDGNEATSNGTTEVTAKYTQNMPNITIPKKEGMKFKGYYYRFKDGNNEYITYYYNENGKGIRPYDMDSSQTLVAEWEPVAYTVQLDPNGGNIKECTSGMVTFNIEYDLTFGDGYAITKDKTKYIGLPVPERNNYVFIGWFIDKNGGAEVLNDQVVTTKNVTKLYAHWARASE